MPGYLLGIDNGSTMTKAGLYTAQGEEIAVAGRKIATSSPHPGWQERDPEAQWRMACEAIGEVLEKSGVDPGDVACVAAAGYGNGLILVDEAGKPVRPAIDSSDGRAADVVNQWLADGVNECVLPLTAQSIWPAQPNSLLAWLLKHEPETMARARWVLMSKDYSRFRLTGKIQAELTDMSGTSLMNVPEARYDDAVLEAFGLSRVREMLPPLVRSEDLCGEVTAEAAAETGLKAGTPVAGGMFDIDACGLAAGMVDDGQMIMVAGTWGNNQYISDAPLIDKDLFMTSIYSIPGQFLMLEGSPTSASNLEWFVSEFFQAEREAAEQAGGSVYDLCNDLVTATAPEQAAIVFLPFLYGSNAHPDAKSCFAGLSGWHTRGHVLRAIYEGVAFGHKTHVDRLLQFRPPPEVFRLTGGASRSEEWVQIFADSLQTPVEIPAGAELGALGAAIAAAVAIGAHPGYREAVAAMTGIARTQEPNPTRADLYAAKYERYQQVQSALAPVWKDLN